MEWNFDQLRKLAKDTGVEFKRGTLVAPPPADPSWDTPLSFLLVGELGGLHAELLDNHLRDGKRGAPYVRLSLGRFSVQEDLTGDTYECYLAVANKLLGLEDVKRVVAGGGVDTLRDKLLRTLKRVVEGQEDTAKWACSTGELPGYGKYEAHYTKETKVPVKLSRNKAEFTTVTVDLLYDDFVAKAKEVLSLLKAQKENRKKKRQNTPLYERLNELKVTPKVEDGKVVALVDENSEPLRRAELEKLGLDPDDLGTVEPHPEGSDRGGYRPDVDGAQYDENAGEWQ